MASKRGEEGDISQHLAGGGLRDAFFNAMLMYAMSARMTGDATPEFANTTLRIPDLIVSFVMFRRLFRMRFSDPPLFPHEDSNPGSQGPHPLTSDRRVYCLFRMLLLKVPDKQYWWPKSRDSAYLETTIISTY